LLALVAALLVVEAAVFAIASAGLALYWSCLIVAGILAAAGAVAFYTGRAAAGAELTPARTIRQLKQDVTVAKERIA
jgi:hypothetical protein